MIKLLITGYRNFDDYILFEETLNKIKEEFNYTYFCIIHGGAKGADLLAQKYATVNKIKVIKYVANWGKYKNAAGPIRNQEMIDKEIPDLVIAFKHCLSKGTTNCINYAKSKNIKVIVIDI